MAEYQVDFEEETHDKLLRLPEFWSSVKKMGAQVKQTVAPLLATQIDWLKKKFVWFEYRQRKLLEKFRVSEVFEYVHYLFFIE